MVPVNRLAMHFKNLCNGQVVQIPQLTKELPYPVVGARKVSAAYGHTVMFTLRKEDDILLRIYLPRRYATSTATTLMQSTSGGSIINWCIWGWPVSLIC